jgi:hypothetical protein
MKRALSILLWTLVFLALLAAVDQLLVRVPVASPAPLAVTAFYRDLRSRLFDLGREVFAVRAPSRPAKPVPAAPGKETPPASVEGVIEQYQSRPAAPPPSTSAAPAKPKSAPQTAESAPRYVYADERGELHFAATLAEVPEQYRARVKTLGK